MTLLHKLGTTRLIDPSAQNYYAAMSQSVDSIFAMERRAAAALRELLTERIEGFRNEILLTLAWAFLGLLVVSTIGYFIMRDITVPLRKVVATANRMATGDLSARTALASRKDEIGALAQAFELMVSRLSGLLGDVQKSGLQVNTSTLGNCRHRQGAAGDRQRDRRDDEPDRRDVEGDLRDVARSSSGP